MPDLLTHTLLNTALPAGRLRPAQLWAFVAGGVLPDLSARVPTMFVARVVQPRFGEEGERLDILVQGLGATHIPLGFALLSAFLALAIPARLRGGLGVRELGLLLFAGGATHLLVDLGQDHMRPGYHYLYPVSVKAIELGWYDADMAFLSWPILLPLAVWALVRTRARNAATPAP